MNTLQILPESIFCGLDYPANTCVVSLKDDKINLSRCIGLDNEWKELTIDHGSTTILDRRPCDEPILSRTAFHNVEFIDFELDTTPDWTLSGCTSLITISFDESTAKVKKLGEFFAVDCPCLRSIQFPVGLEEIGDHAFSGCCALGWNWYDSDEDGVLFLPSTVKRVGTGAFHGCPSLWELVVSPDCVVEDEKDGWYFNQETHAPKNKRKEFYTKITRQ